MAKLFSALIVSILLSIAHATGGFLSQASCNGSTFQFEATVEVSDAPDFFITVTPILSGLCPTSSGKMDNSTLNLNKCLGNKDAHLIVSHPLPTLRAPLLTTRQQWQKEYAAPQTDLTCSNTITA